MPSATGAPTAFEPVQQVFDVVAFDDPALALMLNPSHCGSATGFIDMATFDKPVGRCNQLCYLADAAALYGSNARTGLADTEQTAVAGGFFQVIADAPAAYLRNSITQTCKLNILLPALLYVYLQQRLKPVVQIMRQLGKKYRQVFQGCFGG